VKVEKVLGRPFPHATHEGLTASLTLGAVHLWGPAPPRDGAVKDCSLGSMAGCWRGGVRQCCVLAREQLIWRLFSCCFSLETGGID